MTRLCDKATAIVGLLLPFDSLEMPKLKAFDFVLLCAYHQVAFSRSDDHGVHVRFVLGTESLRSLIRRGLDHQREEEIESLWWDHNMS
jgi:hypothetical protein